MSLISRGAVMPRKDCWYCYFISRAQFRRRSTNQSINSFTLDPNQKFAWAKIADIFAKWQPLLFGLIGLTTSGLFLKKGDGFIHYCGKECIFVLDQVVDWYRWEATFISVVLRYWLIVCTLRKWSGRTLSSSYNIAILQKILTWTYTLNKMDISAFNGFRSVWSHFISWHFMEKFDVHTRASPLPPISNNHWNLLEKG